MLVAVGLIIVALLISSLIARNITLPIQKLRDSMKSVQKGNFDIEDIEVISDNEIGSLTRSFNVMTHRIRELMEQNVKEQEQKRKIELKALQSQINPHFLYNTLEYINMEVYSNHTKNASMMIQNLADFMRIGLNFGGELISISKELAHVQAYVNIMNYRFSHKICFTSDIPKELLSYEIFKKSFFSRLLKTLFVMVLDLTTVLAISMFHP